MTTYEQTEPVDLNDIQIGDRVTVTFTVAHINKYDAHYVSPQDGDEYIGLHGLARAGADVKIERVAALPDAPGTIFRADTMNGPWGQIFETISSEGYYATGSDHMFRSSEIDARTVKILYDPRANTTDCA